MIATDKNAIQANLAKALEMYVDAFPDVRTYSVKRIGSIIDVLITVNKRTETDAEKIERLEKQVASQKLTIEMMTAIHAPKPQSPFDLSRVRINEQDTKRPSLEDLLRRAGLSGMVIATSDKE